MREAVLKKADSSRKVSLTYGGNEGVKDWDIFSQRIPEVMPVVKSQFCVVSSQVKRVPARLRVRRELSPQTL